MLDTEATLAQVVETQKDCPTSELVKLLLTPATVGGFALVTVTVPGPGVATVTEDTTPRESAITTLPTVAA